MVEMKKIAFIGSGVMGGPMAGHLMEAGHSLTVYTRTREKAEALVGKGAKWASSPSEAADGADVIMTMVGYPHDVEEVYFGEQGIFRTVRSGAILIDFTTSSPKLAVRIAEEAGSKGCMAIDAPVSGGDVGARNATLSIMCGGPEEAFREILPLLEAVGQNIVHHGPAGSGQHVKMSNQVVIATSMIGVCESLAYAVKAGLDPERVLKSISAGAAGSWTLSNLAPRMLKGNFEPGFYIKHFLKDLRIALDESNAMGLELPGVALAERMYSALAETGSEDEGTQALYKLYQ
ncbi:2-hydroxy-3-oxopropionate reductase [Bhargavaea cecembensis DSE10]|uniref:2-hydroxy-3-oxopropionate reductase n=1 Tax=Bhargavaea cecembensis DSE10 TaxID=1235279 RepID=M7N9J2_9BACL|nr:NAD(P)-dependent oxidoreductase [Bhargavaea cecembensis]EMR05248.1 2-hydroxy-3-oxopropionate reductase [Bhargavaea cecembensis DSE10]